MDKDIEYEDLTPHQKTIVNNILLEVTRSIYTLPRRSGKTLMSKFIQEKLQELDDKDHGV